METRVEDRGLTSRPTLVSSWDATCGALAQSLHVTGAGLGARDFDWEQLPAPPAPGCAWPAGSGLQFRDSHAAGGAVRGAGGREGRGCGPGIRERS